MRRAWLVVGAVLCTALGCSKESSEPDNAGPVAGNAAPGTGAPGSGGTTPGASGGMGAAGNAGTPGPGTGAMGGGTGGVPADAGEPPGQGDAGPGTGELTVMQVEPAARGISAATNAPITVRFDRPVDRATVTPRSFWAFGRWSGPVRDGAYTYSDGDRSVILTPPRAWTAGDRVTVVLSHDLRGADATSLRAAGYSFHFTTATKAAAMAFTELQRMTVRTSVAARTQSYGGAAADLDADGYLDLMVVNEITADMRIFMNRGDGSGRFDAFQQGTIVPLGQRASPSETTDFDGDGIVDLVVANLDANSLSIVLGNGDGTLTKSQDVEVAGEPRGVAVADVEGDGDMDIINTNANGDNLSLLINDGAGRFADPGNAGFFDAGHGMEAVNREFGLNAADMDEDGILDLVIGAHGLSNMGSGLVVNRGNGAGGFQFASKQAVQTRGWQLAVGDLNGDGHEDVVTADGTLFLSPDTVTVLLGDGTGKVAMHQSYSSAIAQPFAVDLGDMDGDLDLDMVVSNYGADWEILKNDGMGTLSLARSVPAPSAASCAILADIDNDGDLDAALIDEIADELIILQQ